MTKENKRKIGIIVLMVFLFFLSLEFAEMSEQLGFRDALFSFLALLFIVGGIVFWVRKSRKTK